MNKLCPWCGHDYGKVMVAEEEVIHLYGCPVFQGLPMDKLEDGKEYVRFPGTNIVVERVPKRLN